MTKRTSISKLINYNKNNFMHTRIIRLHNNLIDPILYSITTIEKLSFF